MSEKPIRVGQRVEVPSKDTSGVVAFVGNTHFSSGKWIGVILDEKKGKNNGAVQGKSYFQCEDGFGVFVRQSQVSIFDEEEDASSDTTKSSIPSTGTTPTVERPKSRLPTSGKVSLTRGFYSTSLPSSPSLHLPCTLPNFTMAGSSLTPALVTSSQTSVAASLSGSGLSKTCPTSFDKGFQNITKVSSETNLAKTPSQATLTKTMSQDNLAKANHQKNLSKSPSHTNLSQTPSQSSLTKTSSQNNLTKSQTRAAKPKFQTSQNQTTTKNNLALATQSNLTKTSSQTSIKQSLVKYASPHLNSFQSPTAHSTPFRKPFVPTINPKAGSTLKNFAQTKLPLGSVTKLNTPSPRGLRDDKSSGKDSPCQEMKKAPSFIETNFVETLTPQFTPGPASAAMLTLEDKATVLQAQQEIENLKTEIVDLNEKLETLKIKRSQDKEKLKEAEKMRLQLEQLVEFKSRIMESQTLLQKDLQKARQEAKEAVEARDLHVEETQELMESVEMLTLDKEMAEEKTETMQLEYDQLKEKMEELMLDLEILKAECAEEEGGIVKSPSEAASIEVKQLEQQNARLRETLVRMRDISAHDKHELQKAQKELEGRKSEVAELTRSKEKNALQLAEMEATISDLQEQVDAALGAEEMCELLTERNLNLEERVAELLEMVADLEAINDMNDQLQENARDLELELREELDMVNAKIREGVREREALNEVIVDQDATIKKFRDLVQRMQEQNLDLRHALEKETNKPMATPSEVIDFKKMFTDTKAHSKAIDLELRRLEVQQANQHVSFLTQYLPNTFMNRGGDHDAVLVLLLLPRMIWKADIVIGGLRDHQTPLETIDRTTVLKSHSVDQYSFASRMLQMLYMLQAMLKQYHHVSNSCSVDLFLKMGTLYPEMAAHERNLDFYVDLLRKDQLDENVMTEHIEKTVSYFQMVYPTHLANEKLDQTSYLCDVSKVLQSAAQAMKTEAARIESLLPPSESNESEMAGLLKALRLTSVEIENSVKRVRRRMPQDGSTGPVSYPDSIQETLSGAMSAVYNVTRALRQVAKASMQQTTLIGDADGGIPSDKLKELLHQSTDIIYGSEDQGPDSLKNSQNWVQEAFSEIANALEKGEYDFDGTVEKESIPPMSLRAEAIKNELKDTEHLKYKVEMKELDLKELKLAVKQKNEELSEMTVRRDMAEKKLSTATRDADITIEKLQRKLDDTLMALRRKEKEFDETMDHLQADIESLEFEKGELREKLKTLNKRTLYEALSRSAPLGSGVGSPSSPTTPSGLGSLSSLPSTASTGVVVKDSPLLLQQIADLKAALNTATAAKHSTIALDMQRKLAALRPLKVSPVNLQSQMEEEKRDLEKDERNNEGSNKESSQQLNELMKLTSNVQKELRELITGVEVVDLTKRRPGVVPVTASSAPIAHLIKHQSKVATLQSRINILTDETTKLMAKQKPAGSISTPLATFPTPQLVKTVAEKRPIKIGRVTVPATGPQLSEGPIPVILQPEHFKILHMKLLN